MTIISNEQSNANLIYWVAYNVIADDFPSVDSALRDPDGLLAIGGDLSVPRLLEAYRRGIFPWYSEGQPILWWSPNPRCVIELHNFRVSRSLRRKLHGGKYRVSFNCAFAEVMQQCAMPRPGSDGTWITRDVSASYLQLHKLGFAISVETWHGDVLCGGLYGVVIGKVFFGESMFSRESDASKIALAHLVEALQLNNFRIIDCQVHSRHLQSLGATPMERGKFINLLNRYCAENVVYKWPGAGPH